MKKTDAHPRKLTVVPGGQPRKRKPKAKAEAVSTEKDDLDIPPPIWRVK